MVFAPEVYQKRRNLFAKKMKEGVLILPSNPESIMSNDVHYPYRQNSNILYFSGFKEPNTVLVLEKSNDNVKFTMFVPPHDPKFEIWNGRRQGVDGAKKNFFADEAFSIESFSEKLLEIIADQNVLYYTFGINPEIDQLILNSKSKLKEKRKQFPLEIIDPEPMIHEMRLIKQPEEIEIMKKGSEISIHAHLNAIKMTRPGMYEYEIDAIYEYEFKRHGAKRAAYPSIVGSGKNAVILHYIENNDRLEDGDLLLVDAGCEYNDYAIDITRTWPINGKFSDEQKKIYEIVLTVQNECIDKCVSGIKFGDLHNYCVKRITEELIKLNLLSGDIDEIIENEGYKRFFMHGLGHNLGIDTHDVSTIPLKERILKPGMVVTIEPGIYIPDEPDIPESYRGIGVRIEDDILITETGNLNLTEKLPKSIKEIEKLVGSAHSATSVL